MNKIKKLAKLYDLIVIALFSMGILILLPKYHELVLAGFAFLLAFYMLNRTNERVKYYKQLDDDYEEEWYDEDEEEYTDEVKEEFEEYKKHQEKLHNELQKEVNTAQVSLILIIGFMILTLLYWLLKLGIGLYNIFI